MSFTPPDAGGSILLKDLTVLKNHQIDWLTSALTFLAVQVEAGTSLNITQSKSKMQ